MVKSAHIGHINRHLHDVLHIGFVGDKNGANVLKNLHGLGAEVALADYIAGFIESNLPGDNNKGPLDTRTAFE